MAVPEARSNSLSHLLVRRFQVTLDSVPSWAWPFHPPVPLVGGRFQPGEGLLIYASAENLSWLNDEPAPSRFTTDEAWDRYRVWYEGNGRDNGQFFPDVGIQPVTDGGLLAAGLFVWLQLGRPITDDPREFIETIAVTNWCKFSVRSATNSDYIADVKRLTPSLPFVVGELAELRPAIVLVPAQVWGQPILAAAMRGASPWTKFLAVPQFNPTVVNCHLDGYHDAAATLRQQLQGKTLAHWMARVRRPPEVAAWRYIARLDDLLRAILAA